ncbi:hypothetical protein [Shewanella mangrovi]|nr:hypothetical protein [Shewanella mangrovi]
MKAYQGGWVSALFDAAVAPVEAKAKKDVTKSQRSSHVLTPKTVKHA